MGSLSPSLEASSLSFRYGAAAPALAGIDLEVGAGEVVALLGPNGAGKSTFLRVAAGERRPVAGRVLVLGVPAPVPAAVLRRVGYAPPRPVHVEPLTGRENVVFFARASGLPPEQAGPRADALVSRLFLGTAADRPAGEYSDGMRRKLLLAECLAPRPSLLLLDEPFAGLDPPSVTAARELLREAAAAGAAVLLATQAIRTLRELADRVVFLHRGRKVADAPPVALLARYGGTGAVEVVADQPPPPDLALPPGIARVGGDGAAARFSTARGSRDLPALLGALVERDVRIREVRVREPDLSDVFHRLTGAELGGETDAGAGR